MTIGFSTSSKIASVALIGDMGEVLWSGSQDAPQAASGACMRLLDEGLSAMGRSLKDAKLFVADLGPGSFTGVRVGVTLAKTLAFSLGVLAGGADAFDLISRDIPVIVPNKRGEWFLRMPGQAPMIVDELPGGAFVGYGMGIEDTSYPDARNFASLSITGSAPEALVPAYLVEPSISVPKKPYGVAPGL